jgi:hypothetical protein
MNNVLDFGQVALKPVRPLVGARVKLLVLRASPNDERHYNRHAHGSDVTSR